MQAISVKIPFLKLKPPKLTNITRIATTIAVLFAIAVVAV
jgi:hypothetical protein